MSCCGPSNVTSSSLLTSNNKIIKFSKDRIVANSGPNLLMDMDLCGLNIPFDQIFRTQLRLPKQASNVSLQYENVLGLQTTFVAIKVTYDAKNKITDDNYIEYFFQGEPDPTRTIGRLMILTGTESKPIPPIALNNPSDKYDVMVDVLAATTKVTFESNSSQIPGSMTVDNLLWTDILSDPSSGDLIIYKNNVPTAYLDVDKIVSIELNGRIILIDDSSAGEYTLLFVDEYNANQANSIITWALADRTRRITAGMQADTTPPAITYTPSFSTTIILDDYANTSGSGVTYLIIKEDLIALWIESVIDNRDGEIVLDDSNIIITPLNSTTPINAITDYGRYSIVIQVDDAARNRALDTFVLNVKNLNAPKIILKTSFANQIKTGSPIGVTNKIWINDYSFDQINKQNIIDIFLQQVIDTEDGNISLHVDNINVTITNNLNQSVNVIAQAGLYTISFSVTDTDDNTGTIIWENINTQLVDQFSQVVSSFAVTISENQAPVVTFISPVPDINLYQFNINGIINKSDLYNFLVATVTDDRTAPSDIVIIQNQIFDQGSSQELVFIDITNVPVTTPFTFVTQHQDSDGKIGTASVNFNVTN